MIMKTNQKTSEGADLFICKAKINFNLFNLSSLFQQVKFVKLNWRFLNHFKISQYLYLQALQKVLAAQTLPATKKSRKLEISELHSWDKWRFQMNLLWILWGQLFQAPQGVQLGPAEIKECF